MRQRWLSPWLVVVAIPVMTSVAAAQSPLPAASVALVGDGESRIVYQWGGRDGADGIWVAGADGSDGHLLVTGVPGINQYHPDWSPDGHEIAFTNENYGAKDIWIADASGTDARLLYDSPSAMPFVDHPAFSPDGTQIVAASYDREPTYDVSTRSALILIDAATGDAHEISVLEGTHQLYAYPRWSPDGNALVASIGLYDDTDTAWIGEAIAVLRRTANGWSDPTVITDFSAFGSYPDWSPAGDSIVFATKDKSWFVNTMTNHDKEVDWGDVTPELHTVRPDGTDLARITDLSRHARDAGQPSWTSDGRVIFTYTDPTGPRTAFIHADGSDLEVQANGATHSRLSAGPGD